jgi:hypothetical protein
MDIRKFDVRLVRRYVDAGLLSLEDYKKHLGTLPDVSSQSLRIDVSVCSKMDAEPSVEAEEGIEADA